MTAQSAAGRLRTPPPPALTTPVPSFPGLSEHLGASGAHDPPEGSNAFIRWGFPGGPDFDILLPHPQPRAGLLNEPSGQGADVLGPYPPGNQGTPARHSGPSLLTGPPCPILRAPLLCSLWVFLRGNPSLFPGPPPQPGLLLAGSLLWAHRPLETPADRKSVV